MCAGCVTPRLQELFMITNASFFLNRHRQGSITGAYSSLTKNVTPSFVLLAVQGPKVVCYVYELVNGDVEVSKTEFTKKDS
jgi:hypothetical protein